MVSFVVAQSTNVAQNRRTRRRRLVSDRDGVSAQRHCGIDSSPTTVMQFQERVPGGNAFAEADAGDDANAVIDRLLDLVPARPEDIARPPDRFGLQGRDIAFSRRSADLAIGS